MAGKCNKIGCRLTSGVIIITIRKTHNIAQSRAMLYSMRLLFKNLDCPLISLFKEILLFRLKTTCSKIVYIGSLLSAGRLISTKIRCKLYQMVLRLTFLTSHCFFVSPHLSSDITSSYHFLHIFIIVVGFCQMIGQYNMSGQTKYL